VRILWVKSGKMLPLDSGGKIRSYNILRQLVQTHEVTFLSDYSGEPDPGYEEEIARELPGAHTIHTNAQQGGSLGQYFGYIRGIFRAAPFAISNFADARVRRQVTSWLNERRFDVAICDFLVASINFPRLLLTPTVLFQHNVESSLWKRRASIESNPVRRMAYKLEAAKIERYERHEVRRFHSIIAVSEHDRIQMLEMGASDVTVVPTGVDTHKYQISPPATANPPRIVFTGSMDWEPNIDAVNYFCHEILPAVRHELPDSIFQIVGRKPPPRVKQLACDYIQVTGTVPSVADYLRDATVVVVPLRAGAGTRLKIFEAMAMGKAVISTSIGAEGLDVHDGRDIILADEPVAFVNAVVRLTREADLRRQYELAAAESASRYDWSNITGVFVDALQRMCSKASFTVAERTEQVFDRVCRGNHNSENNPSRFQMSSAHDAAEIARSASEASKIKLVDVDLSRYQDPPANTRYPLEYAFFLLGDVQNKVVLDLGCGSGEEVVPLVQRGAQVIGIDISPDLIAVAHERLLKHGVHADVRVGSAYETGLPDASVDVVFCMSLLHHLEIGCVKKEIIRLLKPDGLLIVKEPIRLSWTMKQLRRLFRAREDVSEFEYPLNSAQLIAIAEGFEVLATRNFRTPLVPLLERIFQSPNMRARILSADDKLLKLFPIIEHFATIRVMALQRRPALRT
jgi:glycosyltransferase involved in cell wall biosynthesis/SAM-dependent methyltransferase